MTEPNHSPSDSPFAETLPDYRERLADSCPECGYYDEHRDPATQLHLLGCSRLKTEEGEEC